MKSDLDDQEQVAQDILVDSTTSLKEYGTIGGANKDQNKSIGLIKNSIIGG